MFTTNHFIWLGICLFVIVGMLLLQRFARLKFDTILTVLFCVCAVSEITKILCNMQETGYKGGYALDPGDLPFHLCSMQIFFVFALRFTVKREETRERLLGFMVPTMLLGGVIAMLIPTVGVSFQKVQVYQFFLFHAFIVFFAIYVLKERAVNWSWRVFARNMGYVGITAFAATVINSMLVTAYPKVNFMYLVRPPMDNLPVLNLDNGWFAYFGTLAAILVAVMLAFHAIAIACSKRK